MNRSSTTKFDAVIIGAGLSGLYTAHKLSNELGLKVLGFEKAKSVGGTWYWNRYPGIYADTDSFVYRYSFDREVSPLWDMNARYQTGEQMRDYLESVADRNNLTSLYRFDTCVAEAIYNEHENCWHVKTTEGDLVTCQYLIGAAGVLSKPVFPDIKKLDAFKGRIVHTAQWPEGLKIDGLRVGVIGTGSTGTQVIVAASQVASHVTVFQRTAQYVVPAGQRHLTDNEVGSYLSSFETRWEEWRKTRLACGFDEPIVTAAELSSEEQRVVLEKAWSEGGGFAFMFGTFSDIAINEESNRIVCQFIARKIKEIVKSSETVRKLTPTELYARRPVSVDGYYETFNKENVNLVSTLNTPILQATENGLLTADGVEHELDVIIIATGFEAIEGAYRDFNIVGRNDTSLISVWGNNPAAYLGVSTPGFPDFFTVLGPQGIFSNLAAGIEAEVNFISDVIAWAKNTSTSFIEAKPSALAHWSEHCTQIANHTVFSQVKSWIFGTNVHTSDSRVLFYFGGLKEYINTIELEKNSGYPGFNNLCADEETSFCEGAGSQNILIDQLKKFKRLRNHKTVEKYMNSRGQDRLMRHKLFVPEGVCGLWTTETGKPIKICGHQKMAEHAIWSLQCFPDWEWYNINIHPCENPDIFWVECEGRGKINYSEYPKGHYHNHFIFSFEMNDGLIVRAREFTNPTQQMRALNIPVSNIKRKGLNPSS